MPILPDGCDRVEQSVGAVYEVIANLLHLLSLRANPPSSRSDRFFTSPETIDVDLVRCQTGDFEHGRDEIVFIILVEIYPILSVSVVSH